MRVRVTPEEDLVEWFERRGVALKEEDKAACINLNILHLITIPTIEEKIRRNKEHIYSFKKHKENNELAIANLKQKLSSISDLLDLAEGESVSDCVIRGIAQYVKSICAYIPACLSVLTSLENLTNSLLDYVEPAIPIPTLPDLPAIRAISESDAEIQETLKNALLSLQNDVSWCVDFVNSRAVANEETERTVFGHNFPLVTGSLASEISAMHILVHDSKLARFVSLANTPWMREVAETELRGINGDMVMLRTLNITGSENSRREETELCANVSEFRLLKGHANDFKSKICRTASLVLDCDLEFVY